MRDIESMGKELLKGADTQKLKAIAVSENGKKISQMVDQGELERAAKTGDTAALQRILHQVLSTNEGKQLADQLSKAVQKK
jgi:hypothetical protein